MQIGIFGSTTASVENTIQESIIIGKFLAKSNHIIVTGGVNGYPNIVAANCLKNGGKAIAYGVGKNLDDHKVFHNINLEKYSKIIFQKQYTDNKLDIIDNYTRSLKMCFDVDIAIIIGGRVGTMYEFTVLSGLGKDIYILENSGGITGNTIQEFKKEGHKRDSKIQYFKDIDELKKLV